MVLGCLCARCTTLHNLSIRYWEINTDIKIEAVGVNIGVGSSMINGKAEYG